MHTALLTALGNVTALVHKMFAELLRYLVTNVQHNDATLKKCTHCTESDAQKITGVHVLAMEPIQRRPQTMTDTVMRATNHVNDGHRVDNEGHNNDSHGHFLWPALSLFVAVTDHRMVSIVEPLSTCMLYL